MAYPQFQRVDLKGVQPDSVDPQRDIINSLRGKYDLLTPRWKGVVHTAEAELDTRESNALPLINIKFSSYPKGLKVATQGSERYKSWEENNIPVTGKEMSLKELAEYKYHIDLGGGGGTTWVSP